MEIIANQERQSERDEKNNDLLMKIIRHCNKTPPPERILLIGKTGGGKSSLINVIFREITADTGSSMREVTGTCTVSGTVAGAVASCYTADAVAGAVATCYTAGAVVCQALDYSMAGGCGEGACISSKNYMICRGFRMKEILPLSGGLTDDVSFVAIKAPKMSNEQLLDGSSNFKVSVVSMKHVDQSEAENVINYSSKPQRHSGSSEGDDAIYPVNDRVLCKVCYMYELRIVFLPCSHMVACRRCAARLKSCPVCRSGINEALPANLHE